MIDGHLICKIGNGGVFRRKSQFIVLLTKQVLFAKEKAALT